MKTETLYRAEEIELRYSLQGGRAFGAAARAAAASRAAFSASLLEILKGETLALVGPNGSGKTTLLKALNGLIAPAKGRILFAGEDSRVSRSLRARTVYLHQAPYILAGSVSYNVRYGARARGVRDVHDRTREALELLGLSGFERRGHRALSGGEAQRVALARALASGADVFLLDEPTASADAASAALIVETLRARARAGATIVFSTHDPAFAGSLATRTLSFEEGALVDDSSRDMD